MPLLPQHCSDACSSREHSTIGGGLASAFKPGVQEARPAPKIMVARWLHVFEHDLARGASGCQGRRPVRPRNFLPLTWIIAGQPCKNGAACRRGPGSSLKAQSEVRRLLSGLLLQAS